MADDNIKINGMKPKIADTHGISPDNTPEKVGKKDEPASIHEAAKSDAKPKTDTPQAPKETKNKKTKEQEEKALSDIDTMADIPEDEEETTPLPIELKEKIARDFRATATTMDTARALHDAVQDYMHGIHSSTYVQSNEYTSLLRNINLNSLSDKDFKELCANLGITIKDFMALKQAYIEGKVDYNNLQETPRKKALLLIANDVAMHGADEVKKTIDTSVKSKDKKLKETEEQFLAVLNSEGIISRISEAIISTCGGTDTSDVSNAIDDEFSKISELKKLASEAKDITSFTQFAEKYKEITGRDFKIENFQKLAAQEYIFGVAQNANKLMNLSKTLNKNPYGVQIMRVMGTETELNPKNLSIDNFEKNTENYSPLEKALLGAYNGDKKMCLAWIKAKTESLKLNDKTPKEKYDALVKEFTQYAQNMSKAVFKDKSYDERITEYKQALTNAYGYSISQEMLEKYISNQATVKGAIQTGVMIGAGMLTGGSALAAAIATGIISVAEKSTDANKLTGMEILSIGEEMAFTYAGFKIFSLTANQVSPKVYELLRNQMSSSKAFMMSSHVAVAAGGFTSSAATRAAKGLIEGEDIDKIIQESIQSGSVGALFAIGFNVLGNTIGKAARKFHSTEKKCKNAYNNLLKTLEKNKKYDPQCIELLKGIKGKEYTPESIDKVLDYLKKSFDGIYFSPKDIETFEISNTGKHKGLKVEEAFDYKYNNPQLTGGTRLSYEEKEVLGAIFNFRNSAQEVISKYAQYAKQNKKSSSHIKANQLSLNETMLSFSPNIEVAKPNEAGSLEITFNNAFPTFAMAAIIPGTQAKGTAQQNIPVVKATITPTAAKAPELTPAQTENASRLSQYGNLSSTTVDMLANLPQKNIDNIFKRNLIETIGDEEMMLEALSSLSDEQYAQYLKIGEALPNSQNYHRVLITNTKTPWKVAEIIAKHPEQDVIGLISTLSDYSLPQLELYEKYIGNSDFDVQLGCITPKNGNTRLSVAETPQSVSYLIEQFDGSMLTHRNLIKTSDGLYLQQATVDASKYPDEISTILEINKQFSSQIIKLEQAPEIFDFEHIAEFLSAKHYKGTPAVSSEAPFATGHSEFTLPEGANTVKKSNGTTISQLDTSVQPKNNSERVTYHYPDGRVSTNDWGINLSTTLVPNEKGMTMTKYLDEQKISLTSEITPETIKITDNTTGKTIEYPMKEILAKKNINEISKELFGAQTVSEAERNEKIVELFRKLTPTTILNIIKFTQMHPEAQLPYVADNMRSFCVQEGDFATITLSNIPEIVAHETLHGTSSDNKMIHNALLKDLHSQEAAQTDGILKILADYAIDGSGAGAERGLFELISIMATYNDYGVELSNRADAIRLAFPQTTRAIENILMEYNKNLISELVNTDAPIPPSSGSKPSIKPSEQIAQTLKTELSDINITTSQSELTDTTDVFIITNNNNETVNDFVQAIKKSITTILIEDTNVDTPAWNKNENKVGNAIKYIKEQLEAINNGEVLPYPEIGEFNIEFLLQYSSKINRLLKTYQTDGTVESTKIATEQGLEFINNSSRIKSRIKTRKFLSTLTDIRSDFKPWELETLSETPKDIILELAKVKMDGKFRFNASLLNSLNTFSKEDIPIILQIAAIKVDGQYRFNNTFSNFEQFVTAVKENPNILSVIQDLGTQKIGDKYLFSELGIISLIKYPPEKIEFAKALAKININNIPRFGDITKIEKLLTLTPEQIKNEIELFSIIRDGKYFYSDKAAFDMAQNITSEQLSAIKSGIDIIMDEGSSVSQKANGSKISQMDNSSKPNPTSERITINYKDGRVTVTDHELDILSVLEPISGGKGMRMKKSVGNSEIRLSSEITDDLIKITNDKTGKSITVPVDLINSTIMSETISSQAYLTNIIYDKQAKIDLLRKLSPITLLEMIKFKKVYPNGEFPYIENKNKAHASSYLGHYYITLTESSEVVGHETLHGISRIFGSLKDIYLQEFHKAERTNAQGLAKALSQYAIDGETGNFETGLNEFISIIGTYNLYGKELEGNPRAEALRLAFPKTTKAVEETLMKYNQDIISELIEGKPSQYPIPNDIYASINSTGLLPEFKLPNLSIPQAKIIDEDIPVINPNTDISVYYIPKNAEVLIDGNGTLILAKYLKDGKQIIEHFSYLPDGKLDYITDSDAKGNIISKKQFYAETAQIRIPQYTDINMTPGAMAEFDKFGRVTHIDTTNGRTSIDVKYNAQGSIASIVHKHSNGTTSFMKPDKTGKLIDANAIHKKFTASRQDLFEDLFGFNWAEWFSAPKRTHLAWKMHLYSVDELDYQTLADKIIPYLKKNGIYFKTVHIAQCPELLAEHQQGKAFTIYPSSLGQMEQVAKDIDKIIRENNLTKANAHIEGDRQMGDTGRLFYRYAVSSKAHKDKIFDISKQDELDAFEEIYNNNRGGDNYLAKDMTPQDDIWYDFNPAKKDSHFRVETENLTPDEAALTQKLSYIESRGVNQFDKIDIEILLKDFAQMSAEEQKLALELIKYKKLEFCDIASFAKLKPAIIQSMMARNLLNDNSIENPYIPVVANLTDAQYATFRNFQAKYPHYRIEWLIEEAKK